MTSSAAAAIDSALVVVFVALGRTSHHEGRAIPGTLGVAAPFLIALLAGWLGGRVWQRPRSLRMGVLLWVVTLVGGMLMRHFAWNRGTAFSFIVVATIFLGVFLVGWRFVANRVLRA